jgi:VIT1/CCC1 family predicted Fe2+/Mn2+ transporter
MQGIRYWIMQYLMAAISLFVILVVIDLSSGKNLDDGVWMTLAFALAAAAVFIAARYSQSRKR